MSDTAITFLASLLALIIAITTHEAAHGFMAKAFGDPTAQRLGRLTLNPIVHVDPLGTILLPALLYFTGAPFLFGWAKPVPVDFRNLVPRRAGEFMVAIAGPGINFFLAILSALLYHINPGGETFGNDLLKFSIKINVMLGVFNLFPILPMDGGRAFNAFLPARLSFYYSKMEPYGMFVVLALFLIPIQGQPMIGWILFPMVKSTMIGILKLTGHG